MHRKKAKLLYLLIGWSGASLIRLWGRTFRIVVPNRLVLDELKEKYGRVIFAVRHGQIFLGTYIVRRERVVTIISQHRDGEFIYQIARRLGIKAVRGSSTRGGARALYELLTSPRFRKDNIVVTPDGPRGPNGSVKLGVLLLARITGLPILPVAIAAPTLRDLKSWDRFQIPRPFSRAVVLLGEPMTVSRDVGSEVIEEMRSTLEKRLEALNDEARIRLVAMEKTKGDRSAIHELIGNRVLSVSLRYLSRRKEIWWGLPFTFFLLPAERIYRFVMSTSDRLHRTGRLTVKHLPVPVVSVGNITLGGTGKTMFVKFLSLLLTRRGYKVAVLTRGFGGRNGAGIEVVTLTGEARECSLAMGDEPVMLAKELPSCIVIRGRNRYLAGKEAVARFGCDVCILDDGFQFRRLHRDIDIVLLHGENPFGTGLLLPAGQLRESPSILGRADLIVTCRRWGGDWSKTDESGKTLRGVPQMKTSLVVDGLYLLEDGADSRTTGSIKGKKVLAFAGIGDPKSFEKLVESCTPSSVQFVFFPDHFHYPFRSLERLNRMFDQEGADVLVTTEKDAVKLSSRFFGDRPCWVLSAKLVIEEGEDVLEELFAMLNHRLTKNER